jgi:hypothetical protein
MSIEEDLRRRLRHFGLEKAYDASVVCSKVNEVAKGRFKAVSYRDRILKLEVISVAEAHKLKIREKFLIEELEGAVNARINRLIYTVRNDDLQ